jgi:hypothetical protein
VFSARVVYVLFAPVLKARSPYFSLGSTLVNSISQQSQDMILSDVAELMRSLAGFVDVLWLIVLTLLLLGFASAASVDVLKDVFPLRRLYQYYGLKKWLNARWRGVTAFEEEIRSLSKENSETKEWFDSLAQQLTRRNKEATEKLIPVLIEKYAKIQRDGVLAVLSGGSRFRSLLKLPTEQFSGQLSAFAKVVQDRPATYTREYLVFSQGADLRDQAIAIMGDQAQQLFPSLVPTPHLETLSVSEQELAARLISSQEAVSVQVEANLDRLQLRLTEGWAWLQRKLAMVMALVFALLMFWIQPPARSVFSLELVAWLVIGLLSGYVAVVVHNFLAFLDIRHWRR